MIVGDRIEWKEDGRVQLSHNICRVTRLEISRGLASGVSVYQLRSMGGTEAEKPLVRVSVNFIEDEKKPLLRDPPPVLNVAATVVF